jgi:hypothetical protein
MDVSELLASPPPVGVEVEIAGWIIDTVEGLFLLGEHDPRDHLFPIRVKIDDGNIMHAILRVVPMLGGGYSTIFNRAKVTASITSRDPTVIRLKRIDIEIVRNSGEFSGVDIAVGHVAELRGKYGDYVFSAKDPFKDWLDY